MSDTWILSLTGDEPFRNIASQGYIPLISPRLSNPGLNFIYDCNQDWQVERSRFQTQGMQSYNRHDCYTPGVLWALCSQQKWIFGAIAHLIDNALDPKNEAGCVKLNWNETKDIDG